MAERRAPPPYECPRENPPPYCPSIPAVARAPLVGAPYEPPAGNNQYQPPPGHNQYQPPASRNQYPPPASHNQYQPPAGRNQYPPPASHNQYQPPAGRNQYPPPASHNQYPPSYQNPGGYQATNRGVNQQNSGCPPPGISGELWNWFRSVDEDGNGQITAAELEKALVNCNWTSFNPETCRLMVGMFDADGNGTIDINEFASLWKYIKEWRTCFDSFDLDRSGTIDANELNQAFRTFGYNLSVDFCKLCVRVFDRIDQKSMKLDDFIQCCIMLKVLSSKFVEKDFNRTGVIKIYYEEFLKMALDNTIV